MTLKERVDAVGFKTRAGVVEAMRFLTINFAYRINCSESTILFFYIQFVIDYLM